MPTKWKRRWHVCDTSCIFIDTSCDPIDVWWHMDVIWSRGGKKGCVYVCVFMYVCVWWGALCAQYYRLPNIMCVWRRWVLTSWVAECRRPWVALSGLREWPWVGPESSLMGNWECYQRSCVRPVNSELWPCEPVPWRCRVCVLWA